MAENFGDIGEQVVIEAERITHNVEAKYRILREARVENERVSTGAGSQLIGAFSSDDKFACGYTGELVARRTAEKG